MKVGIPREVKNNEYRVAITPSGVHELVVHGHEVYVEKDAGVGSSILDDDYVAAGAKILDTADDVWGTGDLILKVKEPVESEYHRMREGQTLFTYLHLAADRALTEELVAAQGHRHRLRDRRAARPLPAAARPHVRGRGTAGAAGRRPHADARPGRPRGAHGRGEWRVRGEGRRHRRRGLRHERCRHRARHAGRGAAARPRRLQAAARRRDLPGALPDRRLELLRGGARHHRRRPRHRRRARARRRRHPSS